MEAPSRLSTSLCLLHSVFDKSACLREREIREPRPVAGMPDMVHVDNGPDFRSRTFKRGCQDAGIAIEWRPPGRAALRRTHRAPHRHADGEAAPAEADERRIRAIYHAAGCSTRAPSGRSIG